MILFEHSNRSGLWRVEIADFQGRRFVNVRRWFWTPAGELKPTRDGFTFPLERLAELVRAIIAFLDGKLVDGEPEAA